MQEEIWKEIPGYEGLYQVSSLGNVKSLNYRNKGIKNNLKNGLSGNGYYSLALSNRVTIKKTYLIHHLVAKSFIPNQDKKICINHINGIKTDNRVENLEWVTYRENAIHKYRVLKYPPVINGERIVEQFSKDGTYIRTWKSVSEAQKSFNIFKGGHIAECCRGGRKSSYGFIWRYQRRQR